MEWKITKGSKGCILCSKEFCEDEEYYSALFDENNIFIRKDYCTSCWSKDKGDGLFSFWKTSVPQRDKPVQKFVNNEVFLDMFTKCLRLYLTNGYCETGVAVLADVL